MSRQQVLLYNPDAVFYTMPLALLAVGSSLDPARFAVTIVDGRLEPDPAAAVLAHVDHAACLGVSVLSGGPIRDALRITRAAKARRPDLPIVWGGWHPSLFPDATLAEHSIDAVVVGQGEATFAEILERLADGRDLAGVPGVFSAACQDGSRIVRHGPARAMIDINRFPSHDYSLLPVERYFALKQHRQLDYISSQGCRFRCTFCADPFVYDRGWYGLEPARVAGDLQALWGRHHFDDVGFQDETFFTSQSRVGALAEEFLQRGLRFSWMATMRADQGTRLDEAVLARCRDAGLRRVMIGVESGSQAMLDWMKKDATIEQVFASAEKCRRLDIAVLFNLIVGFPGEPPESLDATLAVAKQLRAMSPRFEIAMFYYKPYPGNEIADGLARDGHRFPVTLEEWADFDYVGSSGPWVSEAQRTRIERFKFYQHVGWSRPTLPRAPLQAIARWRCRHERYELPVEKVLVEWARPPQPLS